MKKLLTTYRESIIPVAEEETINVELPASPIINITKGEFVVKTPDTQASTIIREGDYWHFPAGGEYTSNSTTGKTYTNYLKYNTVPNSVADFAFSCNIKLLSDDTQSSQYGLWRMGSSATATCYITRGSKSGAICYGYLSTGVIYFARPLEYDKWYTVSVFSKLSNNIKCILSDGTTDTATEIDKFSTGIRSSGYFQIGSCSTRYSSGSTTTFYLDSTNMLLQNFILYDCYYSRPDFTEDDLNNLHLWNKLQLPRM